jgi:hypothetical protein
LAVARIDSFRDPAHGYRNKHEQNSLSIELYQKKHECGQSPIFLTAHQSPLELCVPAPMQLTLQLSFRFEVRALSGSLVSSAPV